MKNRIMKFHNWDYQNLQLFEILKFCHLNILKCNFVFRILKIGNMKNRIMKFLNCDFQNLQFIRNFKILVFKYLGLKTRNYIIEIFKIANLFVILKFCYYYYYNFLFRILKKTNMKNRIMKFQNRDFQNLQFIRNFKILVFQHMGLNIRN